MKPDDVEDWLDYWTEKHITIPGYRDKPDSMASEAKRCFADAKAAGINAADLKAAAGGDLEAFLLAEQNGITDAE